MERRILSRILTLLFQIFLNRSCMYFTYILECADTSLYVDSTNNLERRVSEHNTSSLGAHYTKIRRPVVLRYSETFETLSEARKREAEIKKWTRKKKLVLIHTSE